jgi:predicted anti-sigma-YlaC factor YlaD
MLSCREVTSLTASDRLAAAGFRQRLAVRVHLLMCRHCRRYARQLRAMARAARELARGTETTPGQAALEARLLEAIRAGRGR